jgi:hypothetical protein
MGNLNLLHLIIEQLSCHEKENLYWLKIYDDLGEEMSREASCKDDYQNNKDKSVFLKRVKITMKINELIIKYSAICYMCVGAYATYKSAPQEYHFPYAFINSLIFAVASPGSVCTLLTSMNVFHHVCYHLFLQFNAINNKFSDIKYRFANRRRQNYRLLKLLHEHNRLCTHFSRFNNFWNIYLAIKFLLIPLSIQLCLYISFFTPASIISRLTFFSGGILMLLFLSSDCLSASMVNKKAHECYQTLNRIFLDKRLSLHVKIKLNNYIQRLDRKRLAFTCYNLLNVTYATYLMVKIHF